MSVQQGGLMLTFEDPPMSSTSKLDDLISGPATQLLDALMLHLPVGLTIARVPNVEIVRVSDAGARLLQRPKDLLEGVEVSMHPNAYRVLDPRTGAAADPDRLPLTRATISGEMVSGEEWLITAEDGRKVPILCNAGPIRDGAGNIIGGIIAWADLTKQKQLEQELSSALTARKMLMLELHHRVKNHMNIVASIIRTESKDCGEEAQALASRLGQRIMALADSYDSLHADRIASVPAAELFKRVCEPLMTEAVSIDIDVSGEIEVSPSAVPVIGIIVNEAVCNAIKHAFDDDREGKIRVSLELNGEGYTLQVRDNGKGLSPKTKRKGGTDLIQQLANLMDGTSELKANDGPGVSLIVRFPSI